MPTMYVAASKKPKKYQLILPEHDSLKQAREYRDKQPNAANLKIYQIIDADRFTNVTHIEDDITLEEWESWERR